MPLPRLLAVGLTTPTPPAEDVMAYLFTTQAVKACTLPTFVRSMNTHTLLLPPVL